MTKRGSIDNAVTLNRYAVPGLGNAIGAVVGAVVDTAFFVFTEVFEYNGKTGTAWFDSWF